MNRNDQNEQYDYPGNLPRPEGWVGILRRKSTAKGGEAKDK